MEYVEGASLGDLVKAGKVPPRAAVQIAEEIASALHAAHNQLGPEGKPLLLVPRDIKPDNIRITSAGEVKLLDFGIARGSRWRTGRRGPSPRSASRVLGRRRSRRASARIRRCSGWGRPSARQQRSRRGVRREQGT